MAGGTWKIIVEEGKVTRPTQSTIAGKTKNTKSKVVVPKDTELPRSAAKVIRNSLVVGTAIAGTGFNQYYSITGQSAQRNRTNVALGYGAAVASISVQLATGNLVGAAITTLGTGLALGNQYVNFQRDITEQNAMAEYLRQQSGTSVSGNRGELYSFRLF
jgi:hypothetical protein